MQPAGKRGGGAIEIEQRAEDRHAHRAQRNQAVFDFSAGKISCRDAAEADADPYGGLQVADVRVVNAQNVVAVDDDGELQQRGEEKEIGIAEDGPAEDAVGTNGFHLHAEIAERIPAEFLGGVGCGDVGDSEACDEADAGAAQQHESGDGFATAIALGKVAGGHHGADAAEEGAELDDAVAPGEALLRQNLRQQAVLRRTEERGLRADQKNAGTFHRQVLKPEPRMVTPMTKISISLVPMTTLRLL